MTLCDLSKMVDTVNAELSKFSSWFRANKLSLNTKKTNFILFGNKRVSEGLKSLSLTIDGNVIERLEYTKFIGIYIDSKLNWKHHVSHIA